MSGVDDVTVVLRECGERTAEAAARLLVDRFGASRVHRVTGRPFVVTLRRALEVGMRLGRPWTLCIDADVLVLPGLMAFLTEARSLPASVFESQGLVLDKLLPARRPAGNHLYRTALLPEALSLIGNEAVLRPEMEMILAMAQRGRSYYQSTEVVGLHDFEQSFGDVYGKAYMHAHKHRQLRELFVPLWQRRAARDADFAVALQALVDADRDGQQPHVSRDVTDRRWQAHEPAWRTKAPFDPDLVAGMATALLDGAPRSGSVEPEAATLQAAIDRAVFPGPSSSR